MKRWWNLPQQRPVVGTRRRVGRALMRAVVAGALSLPAVKPLYSVRCFPLSSGVFAFRITHR